ncbi:MAG: sigma-54-dependent Fis family transcriptional regulator, partial [Planctomycetales bacterium]|nr:sigma-54-dependent Fis family transcriptional regulator [Planctomycetales bacterium]
EGFSADALEAMINYSWPGNIRELENIVQRAVLLSKKPVIGLEMLPPAMLAGSIGGQAVRSIGTGQSLREALEGPERQIILDVLRANSYSRNNTAEQLGINRTTLYKKMKRLGIDTLQCQD